MQKQNKIKNIHERSKGTQYKVLRTQYVAPAISMHVLVTITLPEIIYTGSIQERENQKRHEKRTTTKLERDIKNPVNDIHKTSKSNIRN